MTPEKSASAGALSLVCAGCAAGAGAVGAAGAGNYIGSGSNPNDVFANIDDSRVAADGAGPDDGFSGYVFYSGGNVGRWGDYSAAVTDGHNVWLATEYIPNSPRTSLADWGTFITKVRP